MSLVFLVIVCQIKLLEWRPSSTLPRPQDRAIRQPHSLSNFLWDVLTSLGFLCFLSELNRLECWAGSYFVVWIPLESGESRSRYSWVGKILFATKSHHPPPKRMGAGIVAPPLSLFSLGRNKGSGFAGHGLSLLAAAVSCATVCQLEDWPNFFSAPSGTKFAFPSSRALIRVSHLAFRYWPYGP